MECKIIDVLQVAEGHFFKKGDIVKVEGVKGELIGDIISFNNSLEASICLDCSEQYNSDIRNISLKAIKNIEILEENKL